MKKVAINALVILFISTPVVMWVLFECFYQERSLKAKSNVEVAHSQIQKIQDCVLDYQQQSGLLPSMKQGLTPLTNNGCLDRIPLDPWRNAYHYVVPGRNNQEFEIWSEGADLSQSEDDIVSDLNRPQNQK